MPSTNDKIADAMFRVFRSMKEKTAYKTRVASLSILQLHVLGFVHKNHSVRMNDIANAFDVELPTATGIVNNLQKIGLVRRKNDEEDRRVVNVTLSVSGQKLLTEAQSFHTKRMGKLLVHLSERDKQSLLSILEKLDQEAQSLL